MSIIGSTPPFAGTQIGDKTVMANQMPGLTNEAKISTANARAVAIGALYVYISANMIPYNASLVTGIAALHAIGGRLIREGGNSDVYDFKAYGAYGDGIHDDLVAITNALVGAASIGDDGTEGLAIGPTGKYGVTNKITIPTKVVCTGYGRGALAFQALAGFPAATPIIQLGVTGALAFGCRLENAFVFGMGIADLGVYSDSIQEQSGLILVSVSNCKTKCIHIASKTAQAVKAQNYIVRDVEASLAITADVNAIAIHIEADNNASKTEIGNITINTADGTTNVPSTGLKLEGVQGLVRNLHMEHVQGGALSIGAVTPCVALTVDGVTGGPGILDLVQIGNTQNDELTLTALFGGGATTLIRDNFTGLIFTDTRLGFYHTGIANNTGNPNYPMLKQTTVSAVLVAGNSNDYVIPAASFSSSARTGVIRLTGDAGGTSAITGIASGKHGRRLKLINVSANNVALPHESGSSIAANRLAHGSGGTINLLQHDSVVYEYDAATLRWRLESVQT